MINIGDSVVSTSGVTKNMEGIVIDIMEEYNEVKVDFYPNENGGSIWVDRTALILRRPLTKEEIVATYLTILNIPACPILIPNKKEK